MKNGYDASIGSAVRRRESILASPATAAATTSTEPASTEDVAPAVPQTPATTSTTSESTLVSDAAISTSSSQRVAQAVLSGQASSPPLSPDMARLSTALTGGAGVPGNPIVVTLSERK